MASRRQAVSDVLGTLSNNEIRQRLILYGYPSIPVTDRNRDLLLDTLRHYVDAERRRSAAATETAAAAAGAKSASQTAPNAAVTHISPDLEAAAASDASSSPPTGNPALTGSILVAGAALLLGLVCFHSLVAGR